MALYELPFSTDATGIREGYLLQKGTAVQRRFFYGGWGCCPFPMRSYASREMQLSTAGGCLFP